MVDDKVLSQIDKFLAFYCNLFQLFMIEKPSTMLNILFSSWDCDLLKWKTGFQSCWWSAKKNICPLTKYLVTVLPATQ